MKRAGALLVLLGALSLSSVASAATPVRTITVVNQAGVPALALARVENAVADQARWLHRYWHTPPITFGPGGWEVDLERSLPWAPDDDGYHGEYDTSTYNDATGQVDVAWQPYAEVAMSAGWSVTFSHETLEMLVDPYPFGHGRQGPEVCDPVEDRTYVLNGVRVEDFVLPQRFRRHGMGDEIAALRLSLPTAGRTSRAPKR